MTQPATPRQAGHKRFIRFIAALEQWVAERRAAPSIGTNDDAQRLRVPLNRIEARGGFHLVWT